LTFLSLPEFPGYFLETFPGNLRTRFEIFGIFGSVEIKICNYPTIFGKSKEKKLTNQAITIASPALNWVPQKLFCQKPS